MKSLHHNGIYVPEYDYKGLSFKFGKKKLKFGKKTEEMAFAFMKKVRALRENFMPVEEVFLKNFFSDFLHALQEEQPSFNISENFSVIHSNKEEEWIIQFEKEKVVLDFGEVLEYIKKEEERKALMTKEEKKKLSEERKKRREALKEKYGYALIDGIRVEIANWTAEPSCIFMGRGNHPLKGRWKEGPKEEDIILNLSPDAKRPEGNWKEIVWEPDKMYIAKWKDKLSGKMKYVWLSPSSFLAQKRDIEKFNKARELEKYVEKVYQHIMENINSKDEKRRKIATVCWLIYSLNLRVGDEKEKDEADTVGAITLRPEHVSFRKDILYLDFLGKDAVQWTKSIKAPKEVLENIKYFRENCKEYLFEGITSKHVKEFLSEVMPGLTAKVFRTWRCTKVVKETLESQPCKKEDPLYYKKYVAKIANLEGAKVCNHKKQIPKNYSLTLAKKTIKTLQLESKLNEALKRGKKIDKLKERLLKARFDLELYKETAYWNLNTSKNNYIDPRVYWEWMKKVDIPPDCIYSKSQLKRFSWAFNEENS